MFTGIIEAVGAITDVRPYDQPESGRTLEISAPFAQELVPGQSVAVDGACLTVCTAGKGDFTVEVGASTLKRTIAGSYTQSSRVNLERAVKVGDRLDGHLVQGHVDAVATLASRQRTGNTWFLDFELPSPVFATTILHGSITINGVSLTVNALAQDVLCQVAIFPYSWEKTNLGALDLGAAVNVEGDLIGKYVEKIARGRQLPTEVSHAV